MIQWGQYGHMPGIMTRQASQFLSLLVREAHVNHYNGFGKELVYFTERLGTRKPMVLG